MADGGHFEKNIWCDLRHNYGVYSSVTHDNGVFWGTWSPFWCQILVSSWISRWPPAAILEYKKLEKANCIYCNLVMLSFRYHSMVLEYVSRSNVVFALKKNTFPQIQDGRWQPFWNEAQICSMFHFGECISVTHDNGMFQCHWAQFWCQI